MSLRDNVEQQLASLQGSHLPTSLRTSDIVGNQIRIDLTSIDSMSVEFMELELFLPKLRSVEFDVVKKWATNLSKRITYLLEGIGPLEYDESNAQVLMRSTPPQSDNSGKEFYEIILSSIGNGTFLLKRYETRQGVAGKSIVSIQITIQVLLKLIDDLLNTTP